MSSDYCLLQLFVLPTLEDAVIDWLLQHRPDLAFTSAGVAAHTGQAEGLSMMEQVSGRKRQRCFSVMVPAPQSPALVEQLQTAFARSGIRYQIIPLIGQGVF
jgi:hypothetical protein